jgi:hypothetical protein
MNKKANLSMKAIASLVIIMALLVLLMVFLYKTRIKASSLVDDTECKSSLMNHQMLVQVASDDIVPDILCPTKYYTLTTSDKERLKFYLAESLKSCWGTFARGELELFKKEGTYCHICSVIDFKKKGMKIEGFDDYLRTAKIKEGSFKGLSYAQYLGSAYKEDYEEVENIGVGKQSSDNALNTDSTYATILVYAKGEHDLRELFQSWSPNPIGGETGSVVGGGVLGAAIGGATALVLCLTGFGCAIVGGALIGGAIGGFLGAEVSDDIGWVSLTLIVPYEANQLSRLKCEELPVLYDLHNEKLG